MSQTNAERQKRFRQLTLRERQLKADLMDVLVAAIECDQITDDEFPMPDGRTLKFRRRNGKALVEIVANPAMQTAIETGRLRTVFGE